MEKLIKAQRQAKTPRTTQARPASRRRGMFPFLLIIAGGLLFTAGAFLAFFDDAPALADTAALPLDVGGLPLQRSLTGPAAAEDLKRLHGQGFDLAQAAVGFYGLESEVTIWVSGSTRKDQAGRMLESMAARIAEGRSPFQPLGTRAVGNRSVFELDGMGQKHFYLQSGRLVIWLAARPDVAEQALSHTLAFYP